MKGLSCVVAVFLVGSIVAAGSTVDELLELLKSNLRDEIKENQGKGDNRSYQFQEFLMRIPHRGDSDENDAMLIQSIDALATMSTSEKVSALCSEISTQMHKQQAEHDEAELQEMQKVFPESLRTALAAKTAKDVDEPLVAVGKLVRERNSGRNLNGKLRTLLNDGQQLWEFLRQWQDYFAAVDAGNSEEARQKLQNVIGNSRDFSSFIPRSELLARMNALQKTLLPGLVQQQPRRYSESEAASIVKTAMEKCKTLDDIPQALTKLTEEGLAQSSYGTLSSTLNGLRMLSRDYEEFQRGHTVRLSLSSTSYDDVDGHVAALRNQLLMLILPRVLGLPDDQGPAKDDSSASYLEKLLAKASAASDWALASRVFETAQSLNIQLTATAGDSSALRSFLAGVNQEKAKQYSLAVVSFQSALKTGSRVIPPETIGEHLADIKKASPTDFEQGMQLTISPPVEPDYRGYPPGYPRGRYYPPGFAPATPPPDSLTVPAKPVVKKEAAPPSEPAK